MCNCYCCFTKNLNTCNENFKLKRQLNAHISIVNTTKMQKITTKVSQNVVVCLVKVFLHVHRELYTNREIKKLFKKWNIVVYSIYSLNATPFLTGAKLLHEHAVHPQLKTSTFCTPWYSPVQSINQPNVKSLFSITVAAIFELRNNA